MRRMGLGPRRRRGSGHEEKEPGSRIGGIARVQRGLRPRTEGAPPTYRGGSAHVSRGLCPRIGGDTANVEEGGQPTRRRGHSPRREGHWMSTDQYRTYRRGGGPTRNDLGRTGQCPRPQTGSEAGSEAAGIKLRLGECAPAISHVPTRRRSNSDWPTATGQQSSGSRRPLAAGPSAQGEGRSVENRLRLCVYVNAALPRS